MATSKARFSRDTAIYRSQELRPWMKKYAAWIALHDPTHLPKREDRLTEVRKFAHGRITRTALDYIEKREDFLALVEELRSDEMRRARVQMEVDAAYMVESHRDAVENLRDQGKYQDIAKYTTPYLDRIWPKQDEQQQHLTAIQINIGQGDAHAEAQIASIADDALTPEIEAVEIEDESSDPVQ
jgi:hypothetical protein